MWVGRILAALLLLEAAATFVFVGRHRAHRWLFWKQNMVVWLCAMAVGCAGFAEHAAA